MKQSDQLMLDFALRVAEESSAKRLHAGAVLAIDANVLSYGYNGTPPGWHTNVCEIPDGKGGEMTDDRIVIHAEMNTMLKAGRLGHRTIGATLYCTHSPCANCAKHLITTGIVAVHYVHQYRLQDGIDILTQAGIHCVHHKDHAFQHPQGQHSISV